MPEIALAAAVNIQAESSQLDPWFYDFDRNGTLLGEGEHSWGVGQIRPTEALELTGRNFSVEELRNPETSITLLAMKMARAQNDYLHDCGGKCNVTDLYGILGIAQNGFGPTNVAAATESGLNSVLQSDDDAQRGRVSSARINVNLRDIKGSVSSVVNFLRTYQMNSFYNGTGGYRYQIRQFRSQLSFLSGRYGYNIPQGLEPSGLECYGRSDCTLP